MRNRVVVSRRHLLRGAATLCTLAGGLAFSSAPALALSQHVFSSSFATPGSAAGQVSSPAGVAVNSITHDVYVADKGNRRIDEFSASGVFIQAWGWGVADGLEKFEKCTLSCEAGQSGSGLGEFTIPSFVVVDNSGGPSDGDVYVGDSGDNLVTKFDASGSVISSWASEGQLNGSTAPEGPFEGITGIAVDHEGTLSVHDRLKNRIFEFAQEGSFTTSLEVFRDSNAYQAVLSAGLAVDASGDFFKFNGNGIVEELTSAGSEVGRLTRAHSDGTSVLTNVPPTDLAVEPITDELYVDAGTQVEQYAFLGEGKVNETGGPACVFGPESEGCPPTGAFGKDILRGGTGIGVDPSDGVVYVADATAGKIDTFVVPVIDGAWVSDLASTSATLSAEINPTGLGTQYQLEYGATASYGTVLTGSVGEGREDVPVSHHLQGLLPGTTYHYRVVAHNAHGTFVGDDHTFMTQQADVEGLVLPDGRAWELVSPPNKDGALIEPAESIGIVQAADDGSGITYFASEAIGEDPRGKGYYPQVLSRRGPHGWESQNIEIEHVLPPEGTQSTNLIDFRSEYGLFSPDLSSAVIEPPRITKPLSPEASERTIYLRDNADGSYQPLVTHGNTPPGTKFGGSNSSEHEDDLQFLTASPDLRHIVLESGFALTSEPAGVPCTETSEFEGATEQASCSRNLYEWSDGQLKLVSVLPDGAPVNTSECRSSLTLGPTIVGAQVVAHTISNDGRWVVWTCGTLYGSGTNELYVRDMVAGKTFAVGGPRALFQMMSSAGSKVFFTENGDLYDFDTQTGVQSDLTTHGIDQKSAEVENAVVGANEDGTLVYFVAKGVLAPGGVSGGDNLYLLREDAGEWTTKYITTLSGDDETDWLGIGGEISGHGGDAAGGEGLVNDLQHLTSRVSPDGNFLAFMSDESLTGYDNLDANSGQPDEEVYLFNARSGRLACVSCDPTGARPVGVFDVERGLVVDRPATWLHRWLAGNLPGWDSNYTRSLYQPRYLSNGGRLFFDSPDALVPHDTNGLEDVYEYEPPAGEETPGGDSCTTAGVTFSEQTGGCVNLISDGTSKTESVFYDASENGDDVFFATTSRLSTTDYDNSYDIYDAHACSSAVPCASVPVSPPACVTGDSCKPAPSPEPEIFGPPPSATFNGAGNVAQVIKAATKAKTKVKKKAKREHKKPKRKKRTGKKAGGTRKLTSSGKVG